MEHLDKFMARFAGYGNLAAPLSFVGLEEGGGQTIEGLALRVNVWTRRGERHLEDLAAFHEAIGESSYFSSPFPLQRTWAALCRVRQGWLCRPVDVGALKRVQATELGVMSGDTNLVELLPLPATGVRVWPYASLARDHPELGSRALYARTYTSRREALLRMLIRSAQPRIVVFYGSRLASWSAIAGIPLEQVDIASRPCFEAPSKLTYFLALPHPMARGITSQFWAAAGAHLRHVAGSSSGSS